MTDAKKSGSTPPSMDQVLRRMLATPPQPKKSKSVAKKVSKKRT